MSIEPGHVQKFSPHLLTNLYIYCDLYLCIVCILTLTIYIAKINHGILETYYNIHIFTHKYKHALTKRNTNLINYVQMIGLCLLTLWPEY